MAAKILSSDIEISIQKLTEEDSISLSSFSCGNSELDKFFKEEMMICVKNHHLSAYCARSMDGLLLAIFTLANDSIILPDLEDKDDFIALASTRIPDDYIYIFNQQTMFPAVNIGHLGVKKAYQKRGIGTQIIDFVVDTFRTYDAAGCQFITVDALNTPQVKSFYQKRFFNRQSSSDESNETVRMYLTLDIFT